MVAEAFRFELDPNRAQRVQLAKSVGASRFVYNWGLAESQRQCEVTGKRPRLGELKAQLVGLKKGECPWSYEVSAHIGEQALADLDGAFDKFFKGLKGEGPKSGFPRFKRKGERDSARLYQVTLERQLRVHKIGRVRLKETLSERGLDSRILFRRRSAAGLTAATAALPSRSETPAWASCVASPPKNSFHNEALLSRR